MFEDELDNEEVKGHRDKAVERLRSKYPDESFDDDEQIFGKINEDYDQYDQDLDYYKGEHEQINNMFDANPRAANFLSAMYNGDSPWVAYIREFGPELRDILDDPDRLDEVAEAEAEYLERVAENKQLEVEYQENLEESLDTLKSFQEEMGLSDEKADEVVAALIGIVRDGVRGKFTPETLKMVLNAVNHDSDVETASAEGEVRGKNTKIKEQLRKPGGDGIANLGGRNGGSSAKPMPELGALGNYGDGNMSIFERGGEKRIPYKR